MSRKYKFYDPDAMYFVSFAVVNWIDVFIRAIYKHKFLESIEYCQNKKGLVLHAWVLMPSHAHLIISRNKSNALEDILRDFKKFTSSEIFKLIKENQQESRREWMLDMFEEAGRKNVNNTYHQFWQQNNHPIELSSNFMIEQRLNYLHNNPVKAEFVEKPEDYLYSSARDYAGIPGLLKIVPIE